METRSRKSRSLTPFSVEQFSQEFLEKETLAENSVRVTRKTTSYKVKEAKETSIDEVTSTNKASKKSLASKKWYKTSDYSSEEGENEVSSTRTITQNEKNQIIEDARAAANGGAEISALELYKKSGRYWEIYPKTDYTYSPQSRDRIEIAPGVVAMPNMSRKTIHSVDSSFTEFQHKQTNTDSMYTMRNIPTVSKYDNVSRQLFNNNYEQKYMKKSTSLWSTTKTSIVSTFMKIVTVVTTIFYFSFKTQTYWLSKLHKLASNVMLLDTWLLWKNQPGNKAAKLTALCLVPLLLLGGWWIFSSIGNSSTPTVTTSENILPNTIANEAILNNFDVSSNEIFINQQKLIDDLKVEITNLKSQMQETEKSMQNDLNLILEGLKPKLTTESIQQRSFFYRVNRCCKMPITDMEKYIHKILISLLNDPDFLKNQKGLTDYLHTIFAAREELELTMDSINTKLDMKYNNLIEDSTMKMMDNITTRIKYEITKQAASVDYYDLPDHRIKKIVKNMLVLYDADKTGLVDYAMESMGAQILSTRCTENYHYGKAVVSVLGIPLWYPVNSPRTLITPGINPGQCWAFQNFPGFVMIRLSKRIKIEAFSIEHISRLLVPNGDIDSAPKQFEVYGLKDEYDKEPVLLGEYQYDYDGEPLQFFDVQKDGQVFEIIELRIISNHGNPNYTCLYRFRVHGKSV